MKVGDLGRFKQATRSLERRMLYDALFIITHVNVSKIKSHNSDQMIRIWNLAEGTLAIHHSFLQVIIR